MASMGTGRGRSMTQPAWMTNPTITVSAATTQEGQSKEESQSQSPTSPAVDLKSTGELPLKNQSQECPQNTVSSNSRRDSNISSQNSQQQQYLQYYSQQHQYPHQYQTQSPNPAAAASSHLDRLLDAIDKGKATNQQQHPLASTGTVAATGVATSASVPVSDSPYDWSKHEDPASKLFYYYNYKTGVTQWDMPKGFIDYPVYSSTVTATSSGSGSEASSNPVATCSFNAKTGAFASVGGESYWSQVGRESDREGRQMAAFFDLDGFEQNRQDAKRKKEQLQQMNKKGEIDWRKHKEEAKQKRKRQKQAWLYEDNDPA